ncbi:hypothetical protein PR202_gb21186 [Eleusine coracana subsp. coracana]|uniref:non-specific serine/threonine protein kinase n=1 Tax=Eleusine coracana subsp. coracana TaxID=191504 RepID=A0AAV5FCL1_ELECO|nr:hypothetical protein PR202_gb21186 [Eleusine coracana subsp. coracana]
MAMAAVIITPPLPAALLLLPLLLSLSSSSVASASDTITPNSSLSHGQTLVSAGGVFELGFFSPATPSATFLGIWYKGISPTTVVWVANRDAPINGTAAILSIIDSTTNGGGLVLADRSSGHVFWNVTGAGATSAQLLDSGNLVLLGAGDVITWQSFDHPSDTLLPGMKLGWDLSTGLDRRLATWRGPTDPSRGDYTFGMELRGVPEGFIWRHAAPVYRNGPWNGLQFSGEPEMRPNNTDFRFEFVANATDVYYTFLLDADADDVTSRFVLNGSSIQRYVWAPGGGGGWTLYWSLPRDQCDQYAQCGAYGVCDAGGGSAVCACVVGFSPAAPRDWALRDGSGGCVRRTRLACAGDGFAPLRGVKLPDTTNATVDAGISVEQCRTRCLANCSCVAYAASNIKGGDSGCIIWSSALIDIRRFSNGGQDLYVRLAASDLPNPGTFQTQRFNSFDSSVPLTPVQERNMEDESTQSKDLNVMLFDISTIVLSTNNFATSAKLGEDNTRSSQLNWSKRFDIILGIARGLLYLHQDSRYKVIHRDLKAGNILLDKDMNPKISDFGVARIFGDDTNSHTRKVVGT